MSDKTLNEVLKTIEKKYGDTIAKFGADDLSVDGVLSLGSPMIDYTLYGGVPEGRIIEFSGAEGSGKTSTSFLVAASYCREELKRNPDNPRSIIFLDAMDNELCDCDLLVRGNTQLPVEYLPCFLFHQIHYLNSFLLLLFKRVVIPHSLLVLLWCVLLISLVQSSLQCFLSRHRLNLYHKPRQPCCK